MTSAMKRLAQMVYNMNTVKRYSKIRMLNQTITEASETPFNLLTCDDDPDYDVLTNGTTVAEIQPGAQIIAIQLHMTIYGLVATRLVEWLIGRDPDGAITAANFTVANVYTPDLTVTNALLKKNAWSVGHVVANDRTGFDLNINIPGKLLARAGRMNDGDVIRINFTDDGAGTGNGILYMRGRIVTRGP